MLSRVKAIPASSFAFAAFVVLVPFEDFATGLRDVLLFAAAVLFVWEARADVGAWLSARWRRKGKWFVPAIAGAAALALNAALAFAVGAAREGGGLGADAAVAALRRAGLFFLLFPYLFAAAAAIFAERNGSEAASHRVNRALLVILGVFLIWATVACAYSIDPEESYELFFDEGGPYFVAVFVLLLKLAREPYRAWAWACLPVFVGGLIGAIAVGEFAAGYLGTNETRERLEERELIRYNTDAAGELIVRAQFPFREHNRLASYLLACLLLAPIAFFQTGRATRITIAVAGALAFAGIVVSGTRGAMLAAVAGFAVLFFARPRLLLIAVPVAAIVFFILPAGMRYHVQSIFDPKTYAERIGSVQYRFRGWEITSDMIRERPLLGFGYGWKTYETIYPRYAEGKEFYEKDMPHAHNNLLEIVVEMGAFGGLLFAAYQLGLIWLALQLWRRRREIPEAHWLPWAVLALMVGLHLFGMTNFSLRRSVGFQIWMCWAMAQGLLVASALKTEAGSCCATSSSKEAVS